MSFKMLFLKMKYANCQCGKFISLCIFHVSKPIFHIYPYLQSDYPCIEKKSEWFVAVMMNLKFSALKGKHDMKDQDQDLAMKMQEWNNYSPFLLSTA